ncbi:MAG: hypothetical protein PHO01_03310 [Desulfotomaculaceae bacterium]|nr:hypothetical protein [Desulfotomaculaceae bacterium]
MLDNNKSEKGWARSRREAYHSGREMGYNLGYGQGFESGFEKGYAEGSALGYNNGFLSALKLGETAGHEEDSTGVNVSRDIIYQKLQKLVNCGQVKIFLSGCATRDAEILFKLLYIDVNKLPCRSTDSR